jgi:hypothetical protein
MMVKLGRNLADKEVALDATASHTIMLEGGENPRLESTTARKSQSKHAPLEP